MEFFCGESLCKKPVSIDLDRAQQWPVRCGACGTSLYPTDILERTPANELEPKRSELMTETDGRRTTVQSSTIALEKSKSDESDDADVDRLLAMVGSSETHPGAPKYTVAIALGAAVAVLIVLGIVLNWF